MSFSCNFLVIFMSILQYKGMEADYNGQGVDQLKECIEKIKSCPEDRRLIMTGMILYEVI
jgi:thymidylate synthase